MNPTLPKRVVKLFRDGKSRTISEAAAELRAKEPNVSVILDTLAAVNHLYVTKIRNPRGGRTFVKRYKNLNA